MPDDLVRWNDFAFLFSGLYPCTIQQVLTNQEEATVLFRGHHFEIRPRPGSYSEIDIYGPAALTAAYGR